MAKTPTAPKALFKDPRGYLYSTVELDKLLMDAGNPRIPVQESSLEALVAIVKDGSSRSHRSTDTPSNSMNST